MRNDISKQWTSAECQVPSSLLLLNESVGSSRNIPTVIFRLEIGGKSGSSVQTAKVSFSKLQKLKEKLSFSPTRKYLGG